MSRSSRSVLALTAIAVSAVTSRAGAQGTLSVQGYGYPPGQLSARANGSAGAIGEADPFSPINPAAIGAFGSKILSLQFEPEFRVVTSATDRRQSSTARYPLILGAVPIGKHLVIAASASTLLDRSWATSATEDTEIGGRVVESVSKHAVHGAMNDLRLATSWTNRDWLRVGVGIHGITGRNTVSLSRVFPDSSEFTSLTEGLDLSITGAAASAGVELVAAKKGSLSMSYRYGARMHVGTTDSLYAVGDMPNRLGIGLSYTAIPGTILAFRTSRQNWSSLASLGSGTSAPVDGWDTSIGGDVVGPRFAGQALTIRAGLRNRTLPFQAGGNTVKERSGAIGTGFALARGQVFFDIAAIRSIRDAGLSVKERAWTLSFALSTRP